MFLNLKLVNQRDNLLGEAIVVNYKDSPGKVLQMIQESYRDNPEAIIETIGMENVIAMGLLDPLTKFQYYFPNKDARPAIRGLVYHYQNLQSLFDSLKRANGIIKDYRLNLKARSHSRGMGHALYIDLIPPNLY